jgi:hypothetical protein
MATPTLRPPVQPTNTTRRGLAASRVSGRRGSDAATRLSPERTCNSVWMYHFVGRRVTSAGSSFVGERLAEDVVLARVRIAVHRECAHHGVKYVPLAMNAL